MIELVPYIGHDGEKFVSGTVLYYEPVVETEVVEPIILFLDILQKYEMENV